QGDDGFLRWRSLLAALDLAQVRRLDANPGRYPPHGESSVAAPQRFATLPDVVAERAHVLCSIYYTPSPRQYPPEKFRPENGDATTALNIKGLWRIPHSTKGDKPGRVLVAESRAPLLGPLLEAEAGPRGGSHASSSRIGLEPSGVSHIGRVPT